mmetsp:Transcript_17722/g.25578  ORF Transcript_17722/g.25578 Transcript_17722/m.25578 type:complete len:107 (-) Transcript_17722:986-1306(-)
MHEWYLSLALASYAQIYLRPAPPAPPAPPLPCPSFEPAFWESLEGIVAQYPPRHLEEQQSECTLHLYSGSRHISSIVSGGWTSVCEGDLDGRIVGTVTGERTGAAV